MGTNRHFVVFHGHFYQPPRENPWIEAIERQTSSAPYHNWNERIAEECYIANSVSRILGKESRIIDIVNNYERMSFNIGPTLLSWLEQHAPETYEAILQADKKSQLQFSGHGNAIAQAYNHIILPLANYQDKRTQIEWGLKDFKFRFQRDAESVWLPETAINYPTLEILIELGVKFIILSPYQALKVRPLKKGSRWTDINNGNVDITKSYRCFSQPKHGQKDTNKFIDIFFYHGGLSNGIAFDHYLRDTGDLANKIKSQFSSDPHDPQLISLCTDGESYGHHEPFGDMGLAYLLFRAAKEKGIQLTNYGEYLEKHAPHIEVELKPGPNGEGTSWSCFHGVGRWYRDCGCQTGGRAGWNQKWREPLRKALDKLRDELIVVFEDKGKSLFKNPWDARNDYITVIFDHSDDSKNRFFEKHALHELSSHEKTLAFTLLEIQRQAMLMYTSCGWFFSDISGLETIQILKYAARAIELGNKLTHSDLESLFLDQLQRAKSNLSNRGTGRDIYNHFVKSSLVSTPQIICHYAILSTLEKKQNTKSIYHFTIQKIDSIKYTYDKQSLIVGHLKIKSYLLDEEETFAFCLYFVPNQSYQCCVKAVANSKDYEQLKNKTVEIFMDHPMQIMDRVDGIWGKKKYSIKDMIYDERESFYNIILKAKLNQLRDHYRSIYQENKQILIELKKLDIPIPTELKIPAEASLSFQFEEEIKNAMNSGDFSSAVDILDWAEKLNLELENETPQKIFRERLENQIKILYEKLDYKVCNDILQNHEHVVNLKLTIHERVIQNYIFRILNEKLTPIIDEIIADNIIDTRYKLVNSILLLAYAFNFDISGYKNKIKLLEKTLSDNPNFWP